MTTQASSYAGAGAPAEFRSLCLTITAAKAANPPPPPPPGPGPPPPPGQPGVLAIADCNPGDQHMLWTFSGEDGGEPGTFHPSESLPRR